MAAHIVEAVPNYVDYIKCGEILKSPLDNYQFNFILKCSDCGKIYYILDTFYKHIQKQCKNKLSLEGTEDGDTLNRDEESEQVENLTIKLEEDDEMETEDPLVVIKSEVKTKNPDVYDENEVESTSDQEQFEDVQLNTEDEFQTDDPESGEYEIQNKTTKKRKNILPTIVTKFIKSEKNIKILIEAYKNQPNLWNKNCPLYRFKDKRQTFLEELARDVNSALNLKLTWNEASELIYYIRRKHREEYRRLQYHKDKDHNDKKYKISWFFKDLHFLRPESEIQLHKIGSNLPDLTTDQIIKIIEIYKEYPHLWNSKLIEYICSNKRQDAHIDMLKKLETNVGVKIGQHNLEEYLRTIHNYFSREKRFRANFSHSKGSNKKRSVDYYQHLLYLTDHEGPFQCTDCNRIYSKPLGFKMHMSRHNNAAPFVCSQCNKEFKTIPSYTTHAKRHLEDYEFVCKECDKKFVNYQDLKVHLLTHSGDRPYCCEICGAAYRHVQCFKRHQRRHEKRFSHQCHICSKGYYSKDRYDDHMNSHMNIRSHVCKLCGKGFITSRALKTHAVTHEDVRNHACKLCGKTFKLKIGVLQHMRTHGSKVEIEDKN